MRTAKRGPEIKKNLTKNKMNASNDNKPATLRRIRSATSSSLLGNTSNSFAPITSYYSLNKTLYDAFYKVLEKKEFKIAMSIGLQFCKMALLEIPRHSYYDAPKYSSQKYTNASDALAVCELLEILATRVRRIDINFYNEKKEELKLLLEVAKENCQKIASESKASKKDAYKQQKHEHFEEVLKEDNLPTCMDILTCGAENNLSLGLCPLSSISEDQVDSQELQSIRENHDENSSAQERLKRHYELIHSPTEFSRSTSAPAHLGHNLSVEAKRKSSLKIILDEDIRDPALTDEIATYRVDEVTSGKSKEEIQYEADLERALYLSGLDIQPSARSLGIQNKSSLEEKSSEFVDIDTLSKLYREDFESFQSNQVITVSYVDTYQGRVRGSLNGCTVIAPLLAIHHLSDDEKIKSRNKILQDGISFNSNQSDTSSNSSARVVQKLGIDDETIKNVIDIQSAAVAPLVREKVGLHRDALIVPADVHDYLIEENFIRQEQFVGVHGGNILDDEHLSQLIDSLNKFGRKHGIDIDTATPVRSRSVAATFFFHEHVVCIHRVTRNIVTSFRNQSDAINTKKGGILKRLRFRKNKSATNLAETNEEDVTTILEEETWFEIIDSLSNTRMLNREESRDDSETDHIVQIPRASRIKCRSTESLLACLRWYACSKFSADDRKFIDSYEWSDLNVEFDPRVWQAFVWSD
ncbi:hypothetical protein CTEN210_08470 [Chaetoceros tenuissimus]|uniref:Uncharacterized protein n=1 Tax=Chaetoceros tenuissimus TaxID=426638 RepID=A0AAD3H6R6_9STRA|nr:hypothetical protein CTEN210_08470 [Chaetoceros tenuissimus]